MQDRRVRLIAESSDTEAAYRKHYHYETTDTVLALFGVMFVNAAILAVVAGALTGTGIETRNEAYAPSTASLADTPVSPSASR
ncbi:hypothetical protein [Halorhabdus rudnickae]|uniref:hypothetical protein n=1 Tax=Halorhabdus rudnickae TaxID=1775544 RepID=UPI001FCEDA3C|nr:hypothetical protein [Halorhabdus rudnickae]